MEGGTRRIAGSPPLALPLRPPFPMLSHRLHSTEPTHINNSPYEPAALTDHFKTLPPDRFYRFPRGRGRVIPRMAVDEATELATTLTQLYF